MIGVAGAVTGRADLSESGERGVHAASCFVALAITGLGYALAVGDLTYRYVASWTSSVTPLPYRLGAVWAAPSGSLLVWALLLGLGTSVAAASLPRRSSLRAWTAALLALLVVSLIALACFDTNPFARLPFAPDDGRGISMEWMRPIALVQMPLGYVALSLVAVPSVMIVMGALGTEAWRAVSRRWALACWALLGAAMLLDWRRSYGIGGWVDDWRWAPAHAGTAFGWAGATLLVVATRWRWRVAATVTAGFVAFALGLAGVSMRRAGGWDGVHEYALSAPGRATGWVLLAAVTLAVGAGIRGLKRGAMRGVEARAAFTAQAAVLVVAVALSAAGFPRVSEMALGEGTQATVPDRFGTQWAITLEGVSRAGRGEVVSSLVALRATVNGRARAFVVPELRDLYDRGSGRPVEELGVAGIAPGPAQDLRIDVREANITDVLATARFIPGASWIWIAGTLAVVAALVMALAPASVGAALQEPEPTAAPAPAAATDGETA